MTTEHTLERDKMDALNAIADANMKVSAAKAALLALKSDESKYLAEREKKAIELVTRAIKDSEGLLSVAYANYDGIKELHKAVSELVAWIVDAGGQLRHLIRDFEEMKNLFEDDVKRKIGEIADKRRAVEIEMVMIANDKVGLDQQRKQIAADRAKIEDERATIARAITRLKQGKI